LGESAFIFYNQSNIFLLFKPLVTNVPSKISAHSP
jgi:hypothetical protein